MPEGEETGEDKMVYHRHHSVQERPPELDSIVAMVQEAWSKGAVTHRDESVSSDTSLVEEAEPAEEPKLVPKVIARPAPMAKIRIGNAGGGFPRRAPPQPKLDDMDGNNKERELLGCMSVPAPLKPISIDAPPPGINDDERLRMLRVIGGENSKKKRAPLEGKEGEHSNKHVLHRTSSGSIKKRKNSSSTSSSSLKAFVRVDVPADNSFKTLLIHPNSTTADVHAHMWKKMTSGRKDSSCFHFMQHWLFEMLEDETEEMLQSDQIVWTLRDMVEDVRLVFRKAKDPDEFETILKTIPKEILAHREVTSLESRVAEWISKTRIVLPVVRSFESLAMSVLVTKFGNIAHKAVILPVDCITSENELRNLLSSKLATPSSTYEELLKGSASYSFVSLDENEKVVEKLSENTLVWDFMCNNLTRKFGFAKTNKVGGLAKRLAATRRMKTNKDKEKEKEKEHEAHKKTFAAVAAQAASAAQSLGRGHEREEERKKKSDKKKGKEKMERSVSLESDEMEVADEVIEIERSSPVSIPRSSTLSGLASAATGSAGSSPPSASLATVSAPSTATSTIPQVNLASPLPVPRNSIAVLSSPRSYNPSAGTASTANAAASLTPSISPSPALSAPGTPQLAQLTAPISGSSEGDSEEKVFLRVSTDDGTFKTLLINSKTTVDDCFQLILKKLCQGKVTEQKLEAAAKAHEKYWFFIGKQRIEPGALVWAWKDTELSFKKDTETPASSSVKVSAAAKEKEKEKEKEKDKEPNDEEATLKPKNVQNVHKESDKTRSTTDPQIKQQSTLRGLLDRRKLVKAEIANSEVENEKPESEKLLIRIDYGDSFKTVLIEKYTTVFDALELLYKKINNKNKIGEESSKEIREKWSLYFDDGKKVAHLDHGDMLWLLLQTQHLYRLRCTMNIDEPIPKGSALSEIKDQEEKLLGLQSKRIKELEKEVEGLKRKLEKQQKTKKGVSSRINIDTTRIEIQDTVAPMGGCGARVVAVSVDGWKCIMKEINLETAMNVDGLEQEIVLLRDLPYHPHVIRYHFYQKNEKILRLFVEMYHMTLRQKLDEMKRTGEGAVPIGTIKTWLTDIVSGMNFLHAQRILHRDLKANNVFVTLGDGSKVARLAIADFDTALQLRSANDVATDCIGTPGFIAPEVLNVKEVGGYSFKADIYSFGIIIYEIMTFLMPQDGFDQSAKIAEHVLKGVRPEIPAHISEIDEYKPIIQLYLKCTEFDADMRPDSDDLMELVNDLPD